MNSPQPAGPTSHTPDRRLQLHLRQLVADHMARGYTVVRRDPLTLLRGTGPNAPGYQLQAGILSEVRGIDIYPAL